MAKQALIEQRPWLLASITAATAFYFLSDNPVFEGTWGLLAVLAAQVASGLLSDDEIAFSGPLGRFVSGDTVAQATAYHAHWGQYLLYALVALHLLAIFFYAWRMNNLDIKFDVHED